MVNFEYFKTLCEKYGFNVEVGIINDGPTTVCGHLACLNNPPYFMCYVEDNPNGIMIFNGTGVFHLNKKIVEKELKKEIKRRKEQLIENKKHELMSDFK